MADNGYKITKKMKILAGVSIPLAAITMIIFLVAVYTKNKPFVIISMILFISAMFFELVVCSYFMKEWYKNYKEKYKGL